MFDYDEVLENLQDFNKLNPKKRRKMIRKLFFDESFIKWLYQPEKVANLTELVSDLYEEFTKKIVMDAIIDVVKEEGYYEFNNSHATFIFSIANIAIESNNDALKEAHQQKKDGEISARDYKTIVSRVEEINESVAKLIKLARKIVKRKASEIARESNLPKYIAVAALTTVPEPKYVNRYQIGIYLNSLFNTIYSDVNENGEFDKNVRWRTFFKEIFGKDNVIEVATFILLEGVHRIDRYANSKDVRVCWDSLTSFALKELNDAPNALREQMIELYIKRIDKMFNNKSVDLRVDLTDLNERVFPNLVKTIERYTDKICDILSRGKDND